MNKYHLSLRTCVGCRTRKPKEELTRLVVGAKGGLEIDRRGNSLGRGAYLCRASGKADWPCLQEALKTKAFSRALRREKLSWPQ